MIQTALPAEPPWRVHFKVRKTQGTLRVDTDVLAWFDKQGRGYQTRMNLALRKAMGGEIDLSS